MFLRKLQGNIDFSSGPHILLNFFLDNYLSIYLFLINQLLNTNLLGVTWSYPGFTLKVYAFRSLFFSVNLQSQIISKPIKKTGHKPGLRQCNQQKQLRGLISRGKPPRALLPFVRYPAALNDAILHQLCHCGKHGHHY